MSRAFPTLARLLLACLGWICLLAIDSRAYACAHKRLRVAIDVGHSLSAPGALSATGRREYDFNRRFAAELLERAAAWRALDVFLLNASGKAISLAQRPNEAAERRADLFLSIHHDSVTKKYVRYWEHNGRRLEYSDAFTGFSLFIAESGAHAGESRAIATLMGNNLRTAGLVATQHHAEPIPGENRRLLDAKAGIYAAPFAVLRHARMPAVLLEVGVIANRLEERELEDSQHRARIQAAILLALIQRCELS
jgi:N-acetylmuramoyl-L-alanine amidase